MDPEDENESESGLLRSFDEVIKLGEDNIRETEPESELFASFDEVVKLGEDLEHQAAQKPNAGRHFPYRFGKGRSLSADSYRKGYFTERVFYPKGGVRKKIDTVYRRRSEQYAREWDRLDTDTDSEVFGEISQTKPPEFHVHLENATNVTVQGNVHLHNGPRSRTTDEAQHRTDMQSLRSDTGKRIEEWTKGMVFTQAAEVIVELVSQGRTWVTVTGGPGEGKTTSAFLALKKLHDMGKTVFYLRHPMDYFSQKSAAGSVIMLDDIFGPSCFSYSSLGLWSHVLNDILALTEHRDSPGSRLSNKTIGRKKRQQTVILVSRICVLQSAMNHLGRFSDFMMEPEGLVNLTRMSSPVEERMDIWQCHAKKFRIDVAPNKVLQVCEKSIDGPYGFPHCCKLYASRSLQPLDKSLSMELFFSKPLEFLNQAMKSYMEDRYAGHLLRQMLEADGKLDLKSVKDKLRFEYLKVVRRLEGTLLSCENDVVKFNHSSIYDSAAFVLCNTDPQFVLENCPVAFLNERVRLRGNQGNPVGDLALTTTLHERFVGLFLERLQNELEKNNLSLALCHDSFHDQHFVKKFMAHVLGRVNPAEIRKLFQKHDRESGRPFLFVASISGSAQLLEFVCQYVQLSDQEQAEALFGACEHVSVPTLKFLISHFENLNLNVTDSHSITPLLVSATKSSEEMLRLLLDKRVNVGVHDQQGNSPLHLVCTSGLDRDASVVKTLVNRGCRVDEDSHSYPSKPLHIACLHGHVNIVRALLNVGADMNTTDLWGASPLHTAASEGHSEVVEALIDGKADVNAKDTWDDTPLYVASTCGHVNVVQVLLRKGCTVNVRNGSGDTALASASVEGHVKVVNVLLKGGADANVVGSSGKTPLQIACENGNSELVEALAAKSNINLQTEDGTSPLHTSTINGNASVVHILLGKGANFTRIGKWGETLLHVASFSGNVRVVSMFLAKGIEVGVTDNAGDTPLHVAARNGHIEVIKLLLGNRAVVMLKNRDGLTPMDLARQGNHQDAYHLLHSQQKARVR